MEAKSLCLAGILVVAVVGCAASGPRTPPPGSLVCNPGGVCTVKVAVAGCKVDVDYKTVWVSKGNRDAKIHWKIEDPGAYSFLPDGVFIKTPHNGVFTKVPTGNKKLFTLNDANAYPGEYNYGVRIRDEKNNTDCPVLDPVIVNEM
jgi:hypothetical protein